MMLFFDESFSSALANMSQPYSEAMLMHPEVTYTPCATSSREKTGDIILTKTLNNAEIGDKSDNK